MKACRDRTFGVDMGYAGLQPEDPREIGPYRLLGQLGSGGMGQVFLGVSAGGRPIAVKVIRAELASDPGFQARFRREVAAAQKVSGLFTALVVDADLDSPRPWLATAYVAGPSLAEAVRRHGPLPPRTLLALTAGLAEGLNAIHAAGVVHRDLKPSNVLLAEDGPRVIDFGISQAAGPSAAGAGLVIGSPGFMSPEQVLGYDIGTPSDMFSLGAVLTFAATGHGPFGSGSNAALMYRLVNSPPDLSSVPGELRSLVGSCLAKHPGDRPTARELLAQAGAIQPAPGWLAESVLSGFAPDLPLAAPFGLADTANGLADADSGLADADSGLALIEAAFGQPQPSRRGRHRISRPLASAFVSGVLVAASGVAAFAMIGADRTPSASHRQPQAGAGVVATTPAPASAAPVTPRPPSPAAPSASIAPSAFVSPAGSSFFSSFVTPPPGSSPAATPATSPSAEPSTSRPASSSPSASPSGSTSPSSSPSASTSPSSSASASASSSPSSSGSASSPAPSSPATTTAGTSPSAGTSSPAATSSAAVTSSSAGASPSATGS